ncbi:MAG: hypothetical protein RIQ52_1782 [Pseudomonadota bacterium]|jgi:predicted phage-related endonuclease
MDKLTTELQKIIQSLESISSKQSAHADRSDELLDQCFQFKIDLMAASISPNNPAYAPALQSLSAAAGKLSKAARQQLPAEEAFAACEQAGKRLAQLLNHYF